MHGVTNKVWDERSEPRDEVMLRTRLIDPRGNETIATVVNLSPHGLMARTEAPLATGDVAGVDLPGIGRVSLEVRWALGGRIGCRFAVAIAPRAYYQLLATAQTP